MNVRNHWQNHPTQSCCLPGPLLEPDPVRSLGMNKCFMRP